MRIVEYRVICPTNVPQYQIGNLYMCAQRTKEETSGGEGIEIVANEPYEKPDGEHGQFTHKIMHFKSRVPKAIRWAIPDKYLHFHEKSWNSYPHFHTEYSCPGMPEDFYLLVASQHLEYKASEGCPDNALGLSEEDLKLRKVVYLDIVDGKPDVQKKEWDMHGFSCPEAGITTALPSDRKANDESKPPAWTETYPGEMMICVKVVKMTFHWRGLQTMVEKYALNTVFHDVFLDSHRALMRWVKEWYPMSMEDIRALEAQIQEEQRKIKFDKDDASETSKDEKKEPAQEPAQEEAPKPAE